MTEPTPPGAAHGTPGDREDRAAANHDLFEAHRPALLGLAYRLLGSRADAEDAVQDTFLHWLRVGDVDRAVVANPAAWLTTTCTRRCLDLMRAAHRSRVDYVGPWLPEPLPTALQTGLHTAPGDAPDERLALASSLTTAFLLVLERLTPKERAAFLLREVFELPYPEVARALGVGEAACRKLASRARATLARGQARHGQTRRGWARAAPTVARQRQLLAAFESAVAGRGVEALAGLLADDVALAADGGGKVPTLAQPLRGRDAVLAYVSGPLREYWAPYAWHATELNGAQGVLLRQAGRVEAAVSFAYDARSRLTAIYIVRNPDKLAGLHG